MKTILYLVYRRLVLTGGALLSGVSCVSGQYCDSVTPSFTVDLTASPYQSWVSPPVARNGYCCGVTAPDQCLEFVITLHPDAASIVFSIASGAVPPGALFYQIDCGAPTPVGSPICLSGTGPFHLTFCKPGNNINTFSIETIPNPTFGPDLTLNNGCQGILYANFYDETTVVWNSVSPGATGAYNGYLDCTAGCDTVSLSGQPAAPATVDYLVCGMAANGCIPDPVCDTISVTFVPPLVATIDAPDTVLCYDETAEQISAVVIGGTGPYTYLWDTGETASSILAGPGTHTVTVSDQSGCAAAMASAAITQVLPPSVDAGGDVDLCAGFIGSVTLNGTATNTSDVFWTGGSGTFSDSTSLNPDYTPSAAEVANGGAVLVLVSNDVSGCPQVSDDLVIQYNYVGETVALVTSDVSCFGASDGSVGITVTGVNGPYTFSHDNGAPTSQTTASDLPAGNHTLTVFSSLGCDSTLIYDILSPTPLVLSPVATEDASCAGSSDGQAEVLASGGTAAYQYSWNTTPVQTTPVASGLIAGTYTATVTDANGCTASQALTVAEPLPLAVSLSAVPPGCFGSTNGAVSAAVSGGTGGYTYHWAGGQSSTTVYNIGAGSYSVTVTDSNGCVAAGQIAVPEPPPLVLTVSDDTLVCPGTPVQLSAAASGGTGTYGYSWTPGGQTTAGISVTTLTDQVYTCTVTDNNGCSSVNDVAVTVEFMDPDDLTAMASPAAICQGDSSGLTAVYAGTDPSVTLTWLHCTCPSAVTVFPTSTAQYTVEAENHCGQRVSASVTVTVNPLPLIVLDPSPAALCPGEEMIFSSGTSNPLWEYSWTFGDGNGSTQAMPGHAYDGPGQFPVSVTVTDDNGCMSTAADGMIVTVYPQASAQFSMSSAEESMLDPVFECYNESQNASSYIWTFGDGTGSTATSPVHTYEAFGLYTIWLYANNTFNCPDSAQMVVEVKPSFELYVPNAFTPDNDQYNQLFSVSGFGLTEEGFSMEIYDRWGETVYRSTDIHGGWDGTYRGATVQDGVFTWVVHFKDLTNKTYRREGHVSVLR